MSDLVLGVTRSDTGYFPVISVISSAESRRECRGVRPMEVGAPAYGIESPVAEVLRPRDKDLVPGD